MSIHERENDLNRRSFLLQLAAIGIGTSALAGCAKGMMGGGMSSSAPAGGRIGLQLYTVRDLLEKDFEGTLEKVAQVGYTDMEFAGYYNKTPEQVRAVLDRLKMVSSSTHIGANLLKQDAAAQIRSAKIIGQEYITIPSYPIPRGGGVDAWKAAAVEFNKWGALCRDAGLRLAYHNHAPEFAALDGGRTGYDVLMRETDPALMDFELDMYWAAFADQRALDVIAKYPGRIKLWHVKDMTVTGTTKAMAPVGGGQIDYANIFTHANESGMKHFYVEHDNAASMPGGSIASIQQSYTRLKQIVG